MKIKQALQNPFVLVAQGFVAGAILFFATEPDPRVAEPATDRGQAEQTVEA